MVSGKYKDLGSPYREMTQEEKAIFQQSLDDIRDYFVSEVAKNRNLNKKDVDKIANGLFYLGAEAKELGLVDELGGKDAAGGLKQSAGEAVIFCRERHWKLFVRQENCIRHWNKHLNLCINIY